MEKLNKLIGDFKNNQLTFFVGETSIGKSCLARQLCLESIKNTELNVLYFDLQNCLGISDLVKTNNLVLFEDVYCFEAISIKIKKLKLREENFIVIIDAFEHIYNITTDNLIAEREDPKYSLEERILLLKQLAIHFNLPVVVFSNTKDDEEIFNHADVLVSLSEQSQLYGMPEKYKAISFFVKKHRTKKHGEKIIMLFNKETALFEENAKNIDQNVI
jgi:hypothetical protein